MTKRILSLLLAAVLTLGSLSVAMPVVANAAAMTASQQFVDVLKKWEGFSAIPYKDNTQWTFGYGSRCPDDKVDYYTENPITKEYAQQLLKEDLKNYEQIVTDFAAKYNLALQQQQFDALVSFTYNCGDSWTRETSGYLNTAVRELDTGAKLIYGLGLWSSSAGNYILQERRMKEANMFIGGQYDVLPDNYRWVFLDGYLGTVRYKIFCFDTNLNTPLSVTFSQTPDGYSFAGWHTASGEEVEVLSADVERGQTLYAYWADPQGNILKPVTQVTFPVAATVVNVETSANARTGPGAGYDRSGSVFKGERLTVVEEVIGGTYSAGGSSHNTWCKLSDGRYVAKYYLRYEISTVSIITQPVNGYAPAGSKGKVTVKATGEDLTYTWYHKNAKASSFVQAPTTGNTYATTMSATTNGRYVYCVVSDRYGNTVTTNTVQVFMGSPIEITAQPKDGYASAGSKGKVTVKATGEGLTYTWYHKNAKASSFVVAPTSGPTYATTMSSSTNGRYVYCVVTDKFGNSVTTETARVFMGSPIEITAQPKDGYAPAGSKGKVTVQATGEGLTYTWYHKNAKASSFVVAATSGNTYATTMSSSTDGRYVYCVITDRDGNSVTTDTARVFMGNPVKLTAQPADGYAPKGSKGKVTVQATGEGLSYKWYHKNAKASSFVEAPTTGATYSTTMSSSTDGRYVYCVVTDKFGNSVTTETARVFMGTPLAITAQPAIGYAPKGSKAKTSVRATGEGLTYTWYHKNAKASTFVVAATTGATYATTMSSTTNGRMVYCVVTDKFGNTVTSDMAVLIMK